MRGRVVRGVAFLAGIISFQCRKPSPERALRPAEHRPSPEALADDGGPTQTHALEANAAYLTDGLYEDAASVQAKSLKVVSGSPASRSNILTIRPPTGPARSRGEGIRSAPANPRFKVGGATFDAGTMTPPCSLRRGEWKMPRFRDIPLMVPT